MCRCQKARKQQKEVQFEKQYLKLKIYEGAHSKAKNTFQISLKIN